MIELIRVREDGNSTYGVLCINSIPRFVTLEDLWRGNARQVSCIPKGEYICIKHLSPKFGWTYLVLDVPDRSDILFHCGNTDRDTSGCILLGSCFNSEEGGEGIIGSRIAFEAFKLLLKDESSFKLQIRDSIPLGDSK